MLKALLLLSGTGIARLIYGPEKYLQKSDRFKGIVSMSLSMACIIWVLCLVLSLCGAAGNDLPFAIAYMIALPVALLIWAITEKQKQALTTSSTDVNGPATADDVIAHSVNLNENSQPNSVHTLETQSEIPLAEPPAAPQNKNTKQRFCKNCGGEIDVKTKICKSCGKQYFKAKKILKALPVFMLTLLLCGSVILNILMIQRIKLLESQSKRLDTELYNKNSIIKGNENRIQELRTQLDEYQKKEKKEEKPDQEGESASISREGLSNSGSFDTVSAFNTAIQRNPTTMENTIVTVNCYIVRNNSSIRGVDKDDIDTASRWMLTSGNIPPLLAPSISITMRDDTQNRALTYDYVKLTGIYTDGDIIDATFEMIESAN